MGVDIIVPRWAVEASDALLSPVFKSLGLKEASPGLIARGSRIICMCKDSQERKEEIEALKKKIRDDDFPSKD